jgi:phage terminase large subunit-like protein
MSARREILTRHSYSAVATEAALEYMEQVLQGDRPCGELERLAVQRQIEDLQSAQHEGEDFPFRFRPHRAQRVFEVFSFLRHWKGEWAGSQFMFAGWQAFAIWVSFGWVRAVDETRRFRTVYMQVARKNGKSVLGAGVGTYLLIGDGEPGAEVYSVATKMDQARIVHENGIKMIESAPALARHCTILRNNISVERSSSKWAPLGRDADTQDGLNVHGAIVDELHAHKSREMWDVIDSAQGSRRQPMVFVITTAGSRADSLICWEQRDYSANVLRRLVRDDSFFAFITEPDEEDPWDHEITWRKANPNLWISVKLDDLEQRAHKARHAPAAQNEFRRKRCNQWVEQDERWLDMGAWNSCPAVAYALDRRRAIGGLDLSSTQDLAAFVLAFDTSDLAEGLDREISLLSFFWVPKETMHSRDKREREMIEQWIADGWIKATPGNVIDYDFIRTDIQALGEKFHIAQIWFDPYRATQVVTQLQNDGFEMVAHRQGFLSMAAPTQEFEDLVVSAKLNHGDNPVMRWMARNAAVLMDPAGNKKPTKATGKGRARRKIDGIVAGVMALNGLSRDTKPKGSVYRTRGLKAL